MSNEQPVEAEVLHMPEPAPQEALVVQGEVVGPPGPGEWRAMREQADIICRTEFVPLAFRGKPDAVLAAILTGRELHLGPMQSLQQIAIVDGKPAYSAELMRALVRRRGHTLKVVRSDHEAAVLYGKRKDTGEDDEVRWDLEDALRANLVDRLDESGRPIARSHNGKPLPWELYTRALLLARATSELVRRLFSDVMVGGSYTPEELEGWDEPPAPPSEEVVEARKLIAAARDEGRITNDLLKAAAHELGLGSVGWLDLSEAQLMEVLSTAIGLAGQQDTEGSSGPGPVEETAEAHSAPETSPDPAPTGKASLTDRIRVFIGDDWQPGPDDESGDAKQERDILLKDAAEVIENKDWSEAVVRKLLQLPKVRQDAAKTLGTATLDELRDAVELLEAEERRLADTTS